MTGRRATIKDVARAVGVSPTTVSHVLNDRGRVGSETRERVLSQVKALGYEANPTASNLRRSRFGAIGLYLPERSLTFDFYTAMMHGASTAAFARGRALSLIPPNLAPGELAGLGLDGVIVAEPVVDDPMIDGWLSRGVPVVFCEAPPIEGAAAGAYVDPDHMSCLGALLDHLVECGGSRFAAVVPDLSTWWGGSITRAIDAWSELHDVRVRRFPLIFGADVAKARAAIDAALHEAGPDALVVCQQGLGAVALTAAVAVGLRVPDDLLLAATVDGPALAFGNPTVTALDLCPHEIGRRATELLLDGALGGRTALPPVLRRRGSTTR